jgi:hypothetical protein
MHSTHITEKRKHPRVEVKWPVTMMTTDGDWNGVVENISSGGAYIRTKKLLSNSDPIVMGIMGLKRELLWIGAEVVRTDFTTTSKPEKSTVGIGVRFTTVSEEDYQFIKNEVSDLLNLSRMPTPQ